MLNVFLYCNLKNIYIQILCHNQTIVVTLAHEQTIRLSIKILSRSRKISTFFPQYLEICPPIMTPPLWPPHMLKKQNQQVWSGEKLDSPGNNSCPSSKETETSLFKCDAFQWWPLKGLMQGDGGLSCCLSSEWSRSSCAGLTEPSAPLAPPRSQPCGLPLLLRMRMTSASTLSKCSTSSS